MPVVRQYNNPEVKLQALPSVRQNIQTTAVEFGGAQGQALRQAGQDIGRAGDQMMDNAVKLQEEANRNAVWQAYVNLSNEQRGYLYGENGVMTKTGYDALGGTSRAAKDIGSMAEKITGTLHNDRQKAMFREMYVKNLDSTLDGLARHEASQRRSYYDDVAKGVIKSTQQDAAARWNDPAFINQSAEIAVTALSGNMQSKGAPQELIDAETKAMRSGVWKSALEQAIAQNPIQAKELLDKNRDKLTGEHAAEVDNLIKKPLINARASAIAAQILTPQGSLPNAVAQRITQQAIAQGVPPAVAMTIAKLENAKGDPNAKNPRSSAYGIFQFIDSTWAAEGGAPDKRGDLDEQVRIGIQHIKKNTDALRNALGREPTPAEVYLAHQQGIGGATALLSATGPQTALGVLTKVYKGDSAKAAAAIVNNGGRADMSAQEFVGLWDKKYARRATGSAAELPLADQIAAAKALAGDDPELQQAAVAAVTEQRKLAKQMQQDMEDEAVERVYGHIMQTGSFKGADPKDLAKIDNKTLYELEGKGRNVSTDWAYYDQYMAMTPAEKAAVPLPTLMTKLGATELRAAIKERTDGKAGGSKSPWLQERATILKTTAQEMGIVRAGTTKYNSKELQQYNALSEYMNRRMDAYRQKNGVEMPESEFRQEAARAVTRVVTQVGTLFDDKARVFELNGQPIVSINSMDDVPATVRADIESAIRARGKTVSDALVLSLSKAWLTNDAQGAKLILEGAK